MPIVYIAGPYGDKSGYLAIERNIVRAREAAVWCVQHGFGYYCPHLNSAHFEAIVPEIPISFWYNMDLAFIAAAQFMLILEGWEHSTGTKAEMKQWRNSKPFGRGLFMWADRELLAKELG